MELHKVKPDTFFDRMIRYIPAVLVGIFLYNGTKTKDNLYIYLTQKVKMYISFKFKLDSKKYRFK